ncbi:MAG: chloride channel protein [Lachnospiraceae bacterium]|nr:chloride channel protein [Lachnospiraceae bacterium]
MQDYFQQKLKSLKLYLHTFFKWLFLSVIMGLACGVAGTFFHYSVDFATTKRTLHPQLLFLLPVAGVFIVFLYRACGIKEDKGTNAVINSASSEEEMPPQMGFLIFVATFFTHLCGGSAGREGAALQIGGSIAAVFNKIIHFTEEDKRILILCGMSGLFSALFNTPITAAVFSLEAIKVGNIYYGALIPCLMSSAVAFTFSHYFQIKPVTYNISQLPAITPEILVKVILFAILCAAVAIVFCECMRLSSILYKKYFKNPYLRVLAGSFLIIVLTLLLKSTDYNGAGMHVIARAIQGETVPAAFLLKILFTAITLGAGFKGGEIVPVFFIGSTFGCFAGTLLGLDPGFAAALGLASIFCACVNAPLASVFLSVELFGSTDILLFAIACAVSYTLSGNYSLYSSQRFLYSKKSPGYLIQKHHKSVW